MSDLKRRALLVGADLYENRPRLWGCANDALALKRLLPKHHDGQKNFDCIVRTTDDGPLTRSWFLPQITKLFSSGSDVSLLYFSGHGTTTDTDDLALCTSDGDTTTPGVMLSEIMTIAAKSTVDERFLILDCCFSGAAGAVPQLGSNAALLPPGMIILASSREDQTSEERPDTADQVARGRFSAQLCAALDGGAADVIGRVTAASLYSYLDESFGTWDQRPVLRANVDRLLTLRNSEPAVTRQELQTLADLFPDLHAEFPLDPTYEPEKEPRDPNNELRFEVLQSARNGKLVVPVGAPHLYHAAMNNKGCRLTPLGRHYCRQIQEGLL